jgi:hypothetical protein
LSEEICGSEKSSYQNLHRNSLSRIFARSWSLISLKSPLETFESENFIFYCIFIAVFFPSCRHVWYLWAYLYSDWIYTMCIYLWDIEEGRRGECGTMDKRIASWCDSWHLKTLGNSWTLKRKTPWPGCTRIESLFFSQCRCYVISCFFIRLGILCSKRYNVAVLWKRIESFFIFYFFKETAD